MTKIMYILKTVEKVAKKDCSIALYDAIEKGTLAKFLQDSNIMQKFENEEGLAIWICPNRELISFYSTNPEIAYKEAANELLQKMKAAWEEDSKLQWKDMFNEYI